MYRVQRIQAMVVPHASGRQVVPLGGAHDLGYRRLPFEEEWGEHGVSRHCYQPDAGSAQVKIWSATISAASAVSPASNAPASFHVSAFIAA